MFIFKPVSRTFITAVILSLTVIFIFNFNGCKSESVVDPGLSDDVSAEQTGSKNSTEAQSLSSDVYYYLVQVSNGITSFTQSCPAVTVTGAGNDYTITVDYGTVPCQTFSNQVRRSGKYVITGFINTSRDSVYGSVTFPSDSPYKIYKISSSTDTNYIKVNGTNIVYGTKTVSADTTYTGNYNSDLTFTTNTGATKTFKTIIPLTVSAKFHNLSTYTDDVYIVKGTGVVVDNRYGITFAYTIQDSLTITGNCKYPLRGKAAWVRNGSSIAATYVDFYPNSGECDDVITLIRGSFSKTVNLEQVDP